MVSQKQYKQLGYTFVEMIVYIAIFTVIFALLTSFIVWAYRRNIQFNAIDAVEKSIQEAMTTMTGEIREAKSIYTPLTGATQLSLETVRHLPTGELSSFVDFFLCGSKLCFKKEGESPVSLTSESVQIDNLLFTLLESDGQPFSVQIDMTASYTNTEVVSGINTTFDFVSTVSLRGN